MPLAGCRGGTPVEVKGQRPLGTSRAFSDMCGESAPYMTQRGEHACVRSARNAGVPAGKIFDFSRGIKVRPKRMRAFVLRLVGEPLGGE